MPLLEKFWKPFKAQVDEKNETVDRAEASGARELGIDPKSGKPVTVRLGRYGPMAQIGTKDDEDKPTFASLRPGQSMHTITLEDALKLFKLPRKLGEARRRRGDHVGVGRFGPFVKHGATYASLQADRRSVHDRTAARARTDPRARPRPPRNRLIQDFDDGDPGAERPLRPVHHRRREERARSRRIANRRR